LKPYFGPERVTSRDPYQSIDLIEYYKSYNRHKELARDRQALEGAKVNIFSIFYNFKGNFCDLFFTSEMKKARFKQIAEIINGMITIEY
jgi:hypothetical protein